MYLLVSHAEKYLQFNINKCRQLFISRKRVYSLPPPNLLLNGQVLTQVSEYKYLGVSVTITSNMLWSPHITNVCNKTRRQIIKGIRYWYIGMARVPHMRNTNMHGKISAKTERLAVKGCYY